MIKTQSDHQPRVAIVIPTFNREQYIKQAIDSALAQTYPCQVVVCDHGSSDGTPEVVRSYGSKVKYIRREEDFGPHFCWLDGVLHCQADYVHFLWDDDWNAPTFIEECLSLFNEEVGCVFSKATVFFEKENRYEPCINYPFETGIHSNMLLEKLWIERSDMVSPAAILFRKQDVLDALYQGNLPTVTTGYHGVGPDFFMSLLTLLRYKKFGYVNKDLTFYRAHDGSITIDAQKSEEKRRLIGKAYQDVRDYYTLIKNGMLNRSCKQNKKGRIVRFLYRTYFKIWQAS